MKTLLSKITLVTVFLLTSSLGFSQDIVINEINYNSDDVNFDPGDWVELYNNSGSSVDISNWVFKDSDNTHEFILPAGTTVDADTYLVLAQDLTLFQPLFPAVTPLFGSLGFGFSGGGELLRLFDDVGTIVDQVEYDDASPWPTEPDGNGPSLELTDPDLDNSLGESWAASNASTAPHGTPGEQNSTYGLGIDSIEQDKVQFAIYPNPADDKVVLKVSDNYTIVSGSINIYNISGRVVRSIPIYSNSISFDIGDLSAGVYICRINEGSDLLGTKKLVIK